MLHYCIKNANAYTQHTNIINPIVKVNKCYVRRPEYVGIIRYFTLEVKVKITLEQAMKAQRGSRGIALLFL